MKEIILNKENNENRQKRIHPPKVVHFSKSEIRLNGEKRNKFYSGKPI